MIECDMHTFALVHILSNMQKNLNLSIYLFVIIISSRDFVNFERET